MSDDAKKIDNNQEPMQSAHAWLVEAAGHLGLDQADATALTKELLDLTADVAHNRSRPAAPLTAFLVGLASKDTDEARQYIEKLRAQIAEQ